MNTDRQRFKLAAHPLWSKATIGDDVYVSDMARVRGRVSAITIGDHAGLADFVVLVADAPLSIGRNAKVGPSCILASHAPLKIAADVRVGGGAQILTGVFNEAGEFVKRPIEVGTGAIIGAGAVIMPGATVAAGAYVAPLTLVQPPKA